MTSILTLPSHMTGFLHELGTQSGIYRWVVEWSDRRVVLTFIGLFQLRE